MFDLNARVKLSIYNKSMKLKLLKKVDEAKDIVSFVWQPEKNIDYKPGQYFYFTLPSLSIPDARGATRHFTLSSSPTETGFIQNTTKIRQESGYKETLSNLPIGTLIEGEGPNGTFVFDENEKGPELFIAGGIGITPFRSMIKYISDKNLQTQIYLLYTDTNEEDFAFKDELENVIKSHPNIHIEFIVSSREGHLDETKINGYLTKWNLGAKDFTWWLCGPPPMVDAMEKIMGSLQIPFGKVRVEKFTGY